MQKKLSVLILSLFVITVSAFVNPVIAKDAPKKSIATSPVDDKKAALKKWEAMISMRCQ